MYIIIGAAAFIAGIVITAAVIVETQRADYNRYRRKRRTAPEPPMPPTDTPPGKKPVEFSKVVLGFVMLTYFVGLGFGIYAVNKILLDYPEYAIQALIALFGYVGTPTGVALGFYSWKAKAENIIKIKKNNHEETEGIPVDLNNIHT